MSYCPACGHAFEIELPVEPLWSLASAAPMEAPMIEILQATEVSVFRPHPQAVKDSNLGPAD